MGAVAEFERALVLERQAEGIALAKQRGVYKGRRKALTRIEVQESRLRVSEGESKSGLARDARISRQTLYRYLGESEPGACAS